MQKMGDGLNVWDIIENPDKYGKAGQLAIEKFEAAKQEIEQVIRSKGLDPDLLLTDWKEENVVVDFFQTSPDLPFTLWVIDQ